MGRPNNPDLTKYWKVCLPATLAGAVEFYFMDKLHHKPKYGSRAQLLTELLSNWLNEQKVPNYPNRDELIERIREIGKLSIDFPDEAAQAANELAAKLEAARAGT